jgi:glyoxylase-like metal-dependent hydrolase (beta-lactamase superfamily II)
VTQRPEIGLQLLTEPVPPRGVAFAVAPGIRRLVAENPGPMTYHGTNTYLLDDDRGVTVLDPGPDSAEHVAAILAQAGRPVARILLSHDHPDHAGALPALAAASGARVYAFAGSPHGEALHHGARVGDWIALHTPGHAPDHLCFARDDGTVLTADHVMSFATTVVAPPAGDMAAYMAGLRKLLAREDAVFLPGHGPPIEDPRRFTEALLAHRLAREAAILGLLRAGPRSPTAIVAALYVPLDPRLRAAAEASVLAHLLKLRDDGQASRQGADWAAQ